MSVAERKCGLKSLSSDRKESDSFSQTGLTKNRCVQAGTMHCLGLAVRTQHHFSLDLLHGLVITLKQHGTRSGYQLIKYRLLLKGNSNWDRADSCAVSLVYEEYLLLENIERKLALQFFQVLTTFLFRGKKIPEVKFHWSLPKFVLSQRLCAGRYFCT